MPRTAKPWDELTPTQQRNRLKNERAKKNKETECVAPVRLVDRQEVVSAVGEKVSKGHKKTEAPWVALGKFFLRPSSVFTTLALVGLTSYLVHQFHIHAELSTGLIVEALAIIYASIHATSSSNLTRIFAGAGIVATICFAGSTLHTAMISSSASSDSRLAALTENRALVVSHIASLQESYSNLPVDYITAKKETSEALASSRQELAKADQAISSYVPSSNVDFASVILRLMAMLASMVLIHGLIGRMYGSIKT